MVHTVYTAHGTHSTHNIHNIHTVLYTHSPPLLTLMASTSNLSDATKHRDWMSPGWRMAPIGSNYTHTQYVHEEDKLMSVYDPMLKYSNVRPIIFTDNSQIVGISENSIANIRLTIVHSQN